MMQETYSLFDSSNEKERAFRSKLARACLKNSRYDLVAGGSGTNFFDIDEFSAGRESKDYKAEDAPNRVEELAQFLTDKINELQDKGIKIERLAFIERDTGPVGMITYKDFIGAKTRIETCCIRPRKRLLASVLKGRPLNPSEQVALITDVATSGDTILAAVEKIWQLGGVISSAIVIFDRDEGAREYLAQYDIDLYHIFDKKDFSIEPESDEQNQTSKRVMQFVGKGATR
jgi:orotate phosphoribosyltransferase